LLLISLSLVGCAFNLYSEKTRILPQIYEYFDSAMNSGINNFEFEFNSGLTDGINGFLVYAKSKCNVKVIS